MSTKINVRSPFYLKFSEPALPSVELTCSLINLQNFSIDEFGNLTLPSSVYGNIVSYTSSASDFSEGKFAAVSSATSRTVIFSMSIAPNFSNSGDNTINCNATATQPAIVCSGGITNNGSIPNQSLNTGGASVDINLASYFTAGVHAITAFKITNNNIDYFETSLNSSILSIFSKTKAGVKKLLVEATDGVASTCNSTQEIQITTTAQNAWTSADAFASGGSISQNGTIVNPTVNGAITAKRTTSGGSAITSYPANTTGSDRDVTLFFDVTVPAGYSNSGSTVQITKTFSQPTSSLPTFTCSIAALTNQAVYSTGTIVKGISSKGTITAFSPLSFGSVTNDTSRTVSYSVSPPASGYSNSGGSDISCNISMTQPSLKPTIGDSQQYYSDRGYSFITKAQMLAKYPNATTANLNYGTIEGLLDTFGINNQGTIGRTMNPCVLQDLNFTNNINTYVFNGLTSDIGNAKLRTFNKFSTGLQNSTGAHYWRLGQTLENSQMTASQVPSAYWYLFESTGLISEIWFVDHIIPTFTKIT